MSKCRPTDPIGIFDSGFGGLSVLKDFEKHLPGESLLFYSDTSRLPYGTKSPEEITEYCIEAAKVLSQLGIKLLIVACHTASITALEALQKECSFPVLGINETFRKLLREQNPKKPLLLGTERTIASGYYSSALPSSTMTSYACGEFVQAVEDGVHGNPLLPLLLESHLSKFKNESFDALLLGCTHFPFIKSQICRVLQKEVPCIDPSESLAKETKQLLIKEGMLSDDSISRFVHFYTTGDPRRFAEKGSNLIQSPMSPENVFEVIKEDEELFL